MGAVLTRGGYLVWIWGNPAYKYQTASVGKAFSRVLIGLAVEEGLIQPDDVIGKLGPVGINSRIRTNSWTSSTTGHSLGTTSSDQKTVKSITADSQSPTDSISAGLPTHTGKHLGDKDFTCLAARQRTKEAPLCASAYRYTMLVVVNER